MKRFRPPPKLLKRDKQATWLNQLRDCVVSLLPLDSPTNRHNETTRGTSTVSKPGKGGGGGESLPVWL